MVNSCCAIGCRNKATKESGTCFLRLPKIITNNSHTEELSRKRRAKWLSNISRADQVHPASRVCSDHFLSGRPAPLFPPEHPDWAPTLKLGHNKVTVCVDAASRHERAVERQSKKQRYEVAETLLLLHKQLPCVTEVPGTINSDLQTGRPDESDQLQSTQVMPDGVSCQTDLTSFDIGAMESKIGSLEKDNRRLNEEIYGLREKCLNTALSPPDLESNEDKVRFYTGLANFSLLMFVFRHVVMRLPVSANKAVDHFTELLITIIRLRLNVPLRELAYRFKISEPTASRIFEKWIEILVERLKHLVHWPDREELRKTMPMSFRQAFGSKVAVIIDCFEVFIDRPSVLSARTMTWSNYKHHNTVKFLLGLSPQGIITFVSEAWGGRTSEKYLTENCSLLKNLLPGDVVLADRGFTIEDSVSFYCAELNIAAFTKGKSQLSPSEVTNTRKIAAVRSHVERVIGLVRRKYQMLQGILPINLVKSKDGQPCAPIYRIARVCCALTNITNSVVPFD